MRVLLTGASGFMGSQLMAAAADVEFVCLGRKLPGTAGPNARLVSADLGTADGLASALQGLDGPFDAVMHLAVSRLHRTFPQTALDLFHVNVTATALLLDFAWRNGADRFVLGSTGSVYDGITEPPLREDMVLAPRNYFPVTKFAAEELTRAYEAHMAISCLRFFTPYGPGQTDRLVPGLVDRVRNGQPVSLPPSGGGLAFKATYGTDCVAVALAALNDSWRGVINVASPGDLDLETAARVIGRVLGVEPTFERVAGASNLRLLPDTSRLEALMSGRPMTAFEDGIRAMCA